jgi:hypothetical protein
MAQDEQAQEADAVSVSGRGVAGNSGSLQATLELPSGAHTHHACLPGCLQAHLKLALYEQAFRLPIWPVLEQQWTHEEQGEWLESPRHGMQASFLLCSTRQDSLSTPSIGRAWHGDHSSRRKTVRPASKPHQDHCLQPGTRRP